MKRIVCILSILMLSLIIQFPAHSINMDMSNMDMDTSSSNHPKAIDAVGIVDEIDQAKGVITISHEAIKSLDWPAMTMNFTVKDKIIFSKLSKNKKIHFAFIQQHGKYVITDVVQQSP